MKKKQSLILDQKHPHLLQYSSQKRKKTTGLWGCLEQPKKNILESEKPPFLGHRKIEEKLILLWIILFSEIAGEFEWAYPVWCLPAFPAPRVICEKLLPFWVFVCLEKWEYEVLCFAYIAEILLWNK